MSYFFPHENYSLPGSGKYLSSCRNGDRGGKVRADHATAVPQSLHASGVPGSATAYKYGSKAAKVFLLRYFPAWWNYLRNVRKPADHGGYTT